VWDRDEGAATLRCEGWVYHQAAVKDLAFSPDGKWLTSVAGDSSMILFGIDGSSPPAVKTQYDLRHTSMATGIMNWLRFTYVFENRSA
jgi:WD40 repeat protein